jgi:hypothetical protein
MIKAGILGLSFLVFIINGCQRYEIILHGEITGREIDALSNQISQGATVRLNATNDSTKTDNDGQYVLKGLTPGSYKITASKQSFAEATSGVAYFKIKEIGTTHWESPNEGTNESGFATLPSGYHMEDTGTYEEMGTTTGFLSSEQYNTSLAYIRQVVPLGGTNNYTNLTFIPKQAGSSVRCIKDKTGKK